MGSRLRGNDAVAGRVAGVRLPLLPGVSLRTPSGPSPRTRRSVRKWEVAGSHGNPAFAGGESVMTLMNAPWIGAGHIS